MAASGARLISVDFEVFGRVQGVFFRKFTQEEARKYGVVGWVKNTMAGTVQGTVQGPEDKVKKMKQWLSTQGSPKSRIDGHEFKNEKSIDQTSYRDFEIVRERKGTKSKTKKKKPTTTTGIR